MHTPLRGGGQIRHVVQSGKRIQLAPYQHMIVRRTHIHQNVRYPYHYPHSFEQWRFSSCVSMSGRETVEKRSKDLTNIHLAKFESNEIKLLKEMSGDDLMRYIAQLRLSSAINTKAQSFNEIFDFVHPSQKGEIEGIVTSNISRGVRKLQPEVWYHFINVITHCQDLGEAMVEIYSAASIQAKDGEGDVLELLDKLDVPAMILKRIIQLARNAEQASEACFLFDNRIEFLGEEDLLDLHRELNEMVISKIQALYLTRTLTDITCHISEHLKSSQRISSLLRQQLEYLIRFPTGFIRNHVARLMRWSRKRLNQDQTDILEMQLLGYIPREGQSLDRRWEEVDWMATPATLFLNPTTARHILKSFYDFGRSGTGMGIALKAAMDVAVHYDDEKFASDLINLAEVLIDAKRIDSKISCEPSFIRTLRMIGRTSEAWHLLDLVFRSAQDKDQCPDVKYWAITIGMVAMDETKSPLMAMQMMSIMDDVETQDPRLVKMVPLELLRNVYLYTQLIQKIRLRQDQEGLKYIQSIWHTMLERGISPDHDCLTEYCVALINSKRSSEVFDLLDKWLVDTTPDIELFYRIMKWMIEFGELKYAYTLYCNISSKWHIQPGPRLLSLLLTAAEEASKLQRESGQMIGYPLIAKFLYQKSGKDVQNQTIWDGVPAPLRAREIFRKSLFDQYPNLMTVPGPMEWKTKGQEGTMNALWRGEIQLRKFDQWVKNTLDNVGSFNTASVYDFTLNEDQNDFADRTTFQPVTFQCTQDLFHKYLLLLPHVEECSRQAGLSIADRHQSNIRWDERLLVLSWMRSLDIVPFKDTLSLVCVYLHEIIPPMLEEARSSSSSENQVNSLALQSAAGPLHDYLADWLGPAQVPTNKEIASYIRASQPM